MLALDQAEKVGCTRLWRKIYPLRLNALDGSEYRVPSWISGWVGTFETPFVLCHSYLESVPVPLNGKMSRPRKHLNLFAINLQMGKRKALC